MMSETEKMSLPPTEEILTLSRVECTDSPSTGVSIEPEDDFPDGGLRAWLIVLGVCFSIF
jgi:hypothetical protein